MRAAPRNSSAMATGLLVAPGRPDALAAGLSRILETPGLRKDLVPRRPACAVVAHHTLGVRADAIAEVYHGVVPAGAGENQ